jgi:hypothetical protein
MATLLDDRWAMKRETVYNTPVTVDRFYPMLDGTEGMWDPRPRQGQGMQGGTGRHGPLGSRRFLPIGQGKLKTLAELESKAAGVLLDGALGVSSVNAITGGSQQVFHLGIAGTVLPSATIQMVKVLNGGSESVETYAGCTAAKIVIEQPEDDIATIEVEWDARSISTIVAAATPTYAVAPVLFDHYQGAVSLGGAFTAPTTTALAAVATSFADFVSWKLEIDQTIDDSRWVVGSRNQPVVGTPKIKFSGKVEFNATTLTAGIINGTKFPWQQTWTTAETLGAGFTQLQVAIPQLSLLGDLPKVSPGETRQLDLKADVTWDGTNRDVYVVYRTTDTAL